MSSKLPLMILQALVILFCSSAAYSADAAGDWPCWRGPNHDGKSAKPRRKEPRQEANPARGHWVYAIGRKGRILEIGPLVGLDSRSSRRHRWFAVCRLGPALVAPFLRALAQPRVSVR